MNGKEFIFRCPGIDEINGEINLLTQKNGTSKAAIVNKKIECSELLEGRFCMKSLNPKKDCVIVQIRDYFID